jgi:hypothetical protein
MESFENILTLTNVGYILKTYTTLVIEEAFYGKSTDIILFKHKAYPWL